MVDSAYDKEQKAKETILALKEEIVNLTKLVEQGSGLSMDQDSKYVTMAAKISVAVFRCDARNTGKKSENKCNRTVSN